MKKIFSLIAVVVILASVGCKNKESAAPTTGKGHVSEEIDLLKNADKDSGLTNISAKSPAATADGKMKKDESPKNTTSNSSEIKKPVSGKLIKTGNAKIQVKDLKSAVAAISDSVNARGGYVASNSVSISSAYLKIRIPTEAFDLFVKSISDLGILKNFSVQAEDVTLKYYDLEGRIKAKRIFQERVSAYLRSAKNVEELLEIERELARVTEELEAVEAEMRGLKDQISYSTIDIQLTLPVYETYREELPSLTKGFYTLGYGVVNFFYGLLFFILYVLAFGVPLLLLAACVYFIGFGKIGLVKKLFIAASGKGK